MIDQISVPVGSKSMDIQIGKLAKQADGAAVVRFGDTVVLATAVFSKEPKENADFFPLTVDYREPTYAAGRIPGGWFKREGRPTEKEILTSRLIDRPFRPLFPKGFNHETQIIAFVLSADGQNDPDILAINGASVALTCSVVPFYTPIGAVRVGRLDGRFVLNPTNAERDKSDIDLIVGGTDDAVVHGRGRRQGGLRARHDRRDPLRPRGRAPDRRRPARAPAPRRLPEAALAGARGLPAGALRRGPPGVAGADDGRHDPSQQDRLLRRDQGGQEGGGLARSRRPRRRSASTPRRPPTTSSRS